MYNKSNERERHFEYNGADASGEFTAFETTPIWWMPDAHILKSGNDTEDVPDSYTNFLAKNNEILIEFFEVQENQEKANITEEQR